MSSDQNRGVVPASAGALSVAQLEMLIANKERERMELAQNAASLSAQLQVALELVALQSLLIVGEGGMVALTDLTLGAQQQAATVGLLGQVTIDGLKGKVDDSVIDGIGRIRATGIEAIELTQAGVAASILERTQTFKARSSDVRKRDLVYAVALDKMPRKLRSGGR